MTNRPIDGNRNCEQFLEALELLPVGTMGIRAFSDALPQGAREHVRECASCEAALDDLIETREALAEMSASVPRPGPWFATRVMATIRAQEKEFEEQLNSVWVGVMRLAPKLAAFAALLLVLGSTWAIQLRRAEQTRQQQNRAVDGLFESAPSTANDDIVALAHEDR
jgi:hypothetical protein